MEYSEDDMLMLSGIQHFAFCKRQWALIHVFQAWSENSLTLEGGYMHRNVDNPLKSRKRGEKAQLNGVSVSSKSLGLYGVCDVVELTPSADGVPVGGFDGLWTLRPVEYKHGTEKTDICDEAQLCAQAICLEEAFGAKIESGDLYYGKIARRRAVKFDCNLRARVFDISAEMHAAFAEAASIPADYSPKCRSCSLLNICLPKSEKRGNRVSKYLEKLREL